MRITCPWCGPRDHDEFAYGGDAGVARPTSGEAVDQDWMDYVYLRDNPRGAHLEWWQHTQGCRAWIKVSRHMTSHEIEGAELARSKPGETP